MSGESDPGAVDILLKWKEGDAPTADPTVDRLEVEGAADDVDAAAEGEAESPHPVAEVEAPSEADVEAAAETTPPDEGEAAAFFEWSADRERAIEDALRDAPEGALPRVHQQVDTVRAALESGRVSAVEALALIAEIDGWLASRLADESSRVPVAHGAIVDARADRRRALEAWQEAVAALREFLAGGDPVQLEVASYTADQGTAFLAGARRAVFDAQPEGT